MKNAIECSRVSRAVRVKEAQDRALDKTFGRRGGGLKRPRQADHYRERLADRLGECSKRRRTYAF